MGRTHAENDMKKLKLVMIGNGMAGVRTLEELLKLSNELYDITVFGAEPHTNYNRILLSPVLAGEQTFEEIVLNDLDWYLDNHVKLLLNRKVVQIDRVKRKVIAEDGTEAEYDRLLIATGSTPFILPIPGNTLQGVIGYRDIADTQAMIETAKTHKHAVVIGGGLLGLEAANGLMLRGMHVTVVHLGEWLLERQLDKTSGQLLQTELESRGLVFRLCEQTQALHDAGNGRVGSVQFKNGDIIPADLVVMCTGYYPQGELVTRTLGPEMAERIGPVWGEDDQGELSNMYKRTRQQGAWFIAGSLTQARIYSKYMALQIKAFEEGLIDTDPFA